MSNEPDIDLPSIYANGTIGGIVIQGNMERTRRKPRYQTSADGTTFSRRPTLWNCGASPQYPPRLPQFAPEAEDGSVCGDEG